MIIAIYGGSFDPVHVGHKAIVQSALDMLNIDKIIIVPTYLSPFKSEYFLEPNIRLNLLKKVFKKFNKVEVNDYEVKQKGISYSYNTVNYLKNVCNASKIYFILGQDNMDKLHQWYKIEELKEIVEFVFVTRNGYNSNKIKDFKSLNINIDISSTILRKQINTKYIPKEIRKDMLILNKG